MKTNRTLLPLLFAVIATANLLAQPAYMLDPDYKPVVPGPFSSGRGLTAIQPDGKIILIGGFSVAGGAARPGLARFNPDGSFDPSFDPPNPMPELLERGWGTAPAVQPDGRILLGDCCVLIRLHPDGKLDPTFQTVRLEDPGFWSRVFVLPSGRIVRSPELGRLQRLHPNGALDPSFTPPMPDLRAVATQGEKLLVTGGPAWLSRLNEDGSFDSTFREFGKGVPDSIPEARPEAVFVDAEGNILASGQLTWFWGDEAGPSFFRLKPNGEWDDGFSQLFSSEDLGRLVAVFPDGKLLTYRGQVVKHRNDGSIEAGSAPLGLSGDGSPPTYGLQPDGSLVIHENGCCIGGRIFWRRLRPDLTIDPGFNLPSLLQVNGVIGGIWPQSNGVVLAELGDGDGSPRLAQFTPEGSLSARFPLSDGIALLNLGAQPDGRLFAKLGSAMVRLNPDATIDKAFAPVPLGDHSWPVGGTTRADGSLDVLITRRGPETEWILAAIRLDRIPFQGGPGQPVTGELPVVMGVGRDGSVGASFLPDGRVLAFGSFTQVGDHQCQGIVRLNANGTIDHDFKPQFRPGERFHVRNVVLKPDGRMLLDLLRQEDPRETRLIQLLPDGTIDPAFKPEQDGVRGLIVSGSDRFGNAFVSIPPRGAGREVLRMNSDGALDPTPVVTFEGDHGPLVGQADGSLLVATYGLGDISESFVNGQKRYGLARLNPAPIWRSSTFNSDGRFTGSIGCLPGWNYRVEASGDLQQWDTVATGTSAGESVPFTDTVPPGTARRFYRVVKE